MFAALLVFFVPSAAKAYVSIAYLGLMVASRVYVLRTRRDVRESNNDHYVWFLLTGASAVVLAVSPYPKGFLVTTLGFLYVCSLLAVHATRRVALTSAVTTTFTVICALGVLLSSLALHGLLPGALGFADPRASYDKNFLAVLYFLVAYWAHRRQLRFLTALAVAAGLLSDSRNFVLMLALSLALGLIARARDRAGNDAVPASRARAGTPSGHLILGTLGLAFVVLLFSFWWSSAVVAQKPVGAIAGLNDRSNAVRANSDIYLVNRIEADPWLLIRGYDDDALRVLNVISSDDLDGTETAADGTFFNGMRIVQPPNTVLNLIVREGLLLSLLYFTAWATFCARFLNRSNRTLWVPYLFAALIMHSLLVGPLLLFFTVVAISADAPTARTTPSTPHRRAVRA